MKSMLSVKIKNYRSELGLSREALAGKLGVTAQAVSKWECAQAYPDIELLPELAEIFQVSIDSLLRDENMSANSGTQEQAVAGKSTKEPIEDSTDSISHEEREAPLGNPEFPHDDVLRVVQVLNGRVFWNKECDSEQTIPLNLEGLRNLKMKNVHIEVWGSITTSNDIIGNINANAYVECNNIEGNVSTGGYVECNDIEGDVSAGGYVECNDIEGDVSAGDYIACNDVDGNVAAGSYVQCDDVRGNVAAHDYVECGDVGGSIDAGGYVECGDVGGCVRAGS